MMDEEMGKYPLIHKRKTTFSLMSDDKSDARRLLVSRPSGVLGEGISALDKHIVQKAGISVIFPWMTGYKIWWAITAICSIFTVFFAPFQIAFQDEPGTFNDAAAIIEWGLNAIFTIDIGVNFNLAIYKDEVMIFERLDIVRKYLSKMFWVDLIGVFPFETVVLFFVGELGRSDDQALMLSLLRLWRFVRLHRMKKLSDVLQYNANVSLLWFTLLRNFASVLCSTHLNACAMYFLARLNDFGEDTWLGPAVADMSGFQRYVTSLYFCIVTLCTIGYGDYAPANSAEMVVGSFFMLLNIVITAWIVGSVTLLIVKGDERTGEYRDNLETLAKYSQMHGFDTNFADGLKAQLRLEHHNQEISDEHVLKNFPSAVRRKVLRKLYLKPLVKTQLMKGIRPQFVDAFLTSCKVEIFNPGEVIVDRGSILSDLFLLVGGIAEISGPENEGDNDESTSVHRRSSKDDAEERLSHRQLEAGDFIGEIGFFTETPQVDSVACLTVCKTLTITQATYKMLAHDHPGSVGKILKNLFHKVTDMQLNLPKPLSVLRAGSAFDMEQGYGSLQVREVDDIYEEIARRKDALTAVRDLVQMHMSKQLDDQTTRFCFAASRGDTATMSLMCDQGFDPNNADYDSRTALMVASMKGNVEAVQMLLEYNADANLTDVHGTTALMEAVKGGHEKTVSILQKFGAELCMKQELAASILCQAVFDGAILLLKRLLRAGIQVDAADYDKRTAAHIAAAEGNVAAIRVLAEAGANLNLEDRWGNTVQREAERSNARQLLAYLKERRSGEQQTKEVVVPSLVFK